jgi:DNA polymerase III subunit epsilon
MLYIEDNNPMSKEAPVIPPASAAKVVSTRTARALTPEEQSAAIAALEAAGFRVLYKFTPVDAYRTDENDNLSVGVILDTETTGKDAEKDRIIELGMVFFEYDPENGEVYRIVDVYDELQDPGIPIPPEASAVNGITDEMVKGKQIDGQHVADLVTYVDIVIAHNAKFDRVVCERVWPVFKSKPWACSYQQVNWKAERLGSAKLEFVAFKRGFHYEAHRAEGDCRALLHVLQAPLGETGQSTLQSLLQAYKTKEMRIWATDSPFSVKDALKDRGYHWGDGSGNKEKAWHITVPEADFEAELAWLKANAYGGKQAAVVVDTVDAFTRFSTRRENTRRHYL